MSRGNFIPHGPCCGEGRRGGHGQVPRLADEPQVTQTPGKKRKGPDAMQGRGVPASEEGLFFCLFVFLIYVFIN